MATTTASQYGSSSSIEELKGKAKQTFDAACLVMKAMACA
jgi:hypothetical protein